MPEIIASIRCCMTASLPGAVNMACAGQAMRMFCAAVSEAWPSSESAALCASVGWTASAI